MTSAPKDPVTFLAKRPSGFGAGSLRQAITGIEGLGLELGRLGRAPRQWYAQRAGCTYV